MTVVDFLSLLPVLATLMETTQGQPESTFPEGEGTLTTLLKVIPSGNPRTSLKETTSPSPLIPGKLGIFFQKVPTQWLRQA